MDKSLSAEIIGVGTELLLGNTANTDARDLSEILSELGINVYFHTVVGDNPGRLASAVEIARSRADIIITTGGLGPTYDDLTKQVLAESFGLKLYFDEAEAEVIRGYFARRSGAAMTENNLRQAMLPEGCTVFRNLWGTAPGCAFEAMGKLVIMLPGPPRECNAMFREYGVPYLSRLSDYQIRSHRIHIFGMGESAVEDRLSDLMENITNPTLAPYAKEGEVMLRVTARAKSLEEADAMMLPVVEKVRDTLGDVVYGIDSDSLEATALALLTERNMTIAAAESCTGGYLAKRLTDIPGASKAFIGGVVTYSNASKIGLLGIFEALLAEKGAVSREVASEMARAVRLKLGADFGVGITGVAGPDSADGIEAGTVYVALAMESGVFVRSLRLQNSARDRVRSSAASHALDMLRRHLTGLDVIAGW